MRVLIVLDHPYGADSWENVPHRRSFTAALAHAARLGLDRAGHETDLIDLHADGFNPVMSAADLTAWRTGAPPPDPLVADYQRRLLAADHLVLAFPIWWEAMPAMTKGFIDKVVAKHVAYGQGRGLRPMTSRLTRLRGVTMLTVMSTPTPLYRLVFGNPVVKLVFRGTFRKIGVRGLRWRNHGGLDRRDEAARGRALAAAEHHFAGLRG
jgi:putative NADPH-quinone reductase